MERESNQTQQPNPCRKGCGFYGSAATEGMCSQCYKHCVKRRQNSPITPGNPAAVAASPLASSSSNSNLSTSATAGAEVTPTSSSSSTDVIGAEAVQGATASSPPSAKHSPDETDSASVTMDDSGVEDSLEEKTPKKRNRCFTCRKKVGLTGFECRCGGIYCSLHRYSDKHDCTFDYKTDGQEQIRKNNPLVIGEKIQKI